MRHAFVRIFYLLNTYYLNVLLPQLFQKNGYDFSAFNNIRDILYNTDDISSAVKLIVHSPVGKLVYYTNILMISILLLN